MGVVLEIKIAQSVHEFAFLFKDKSNIEVIGEFDSANCGIGYDLNVSGAACRLFDDIDTRDEENPSLYIEIDRYNKLNSDQQTAVEDYLKLIVSQTGSEIFIERYK